MIIADTNLVVPLLVEHEGRERVLRLFSIDPDWHLPDWWQVELSNVLRNYHRTGLFEPAQVLELQHRAFRLFPPGNTHPVDHREALRVACDCGISAYDARFIVLARSYRLKLVTEDTRLRAACPDETLSLDQALAHTP